MRCLSAIDWIESNAMNMHANKRTNESLCELAMEFDTHMNIHEHFHFHFLPSRHTDDSSPISLCLENVISVEIDCLFDPRDFTCLFSIGKCTKRAMPNENKACQGRESPKGLQLNWHRDLQCRFCWMFGFGVNTSLSLSLAFFLSR